MKIKFCINIAINEEPSLPRVWVAQESKSLRLFPFQG